LPTNREGLAQLERSLNARELQRLMNWAVEQRVDVTVPKFSINYRFKLKEALKAVGIKLMFDTTGDLSGISKKKDLYTTNAVHQSYIKVAEQGTEEERGNVTVRRQERAWKSFVAEHPFILVVRHTDSSTPIFMGRYAFPEGAQKNIKQSSATFLVPE